MYVGFLAYDIFIGASAAQNKTAPLEGVTATSAAPGQTDAALEADKEALLKHAFAILEQLWTENGKDEDEAELKRRTEEVVGEMYVQFHMYLFFSHALPISNHSSYLFFFSPRCLFERLTNILL